MKKRKLCLLASSFLMVGVLANIGAKANEVNANSYTLASVGEVEYSDLLAAFADANDGNGTNVVKLQMSFPIDSSFAFPSTFNVVLDFNGYRIIVPEGTNHAIYNCGTVVLQDTSELSEGGITIENGQWIYNYGNLTFESGHYLSTSWKSGGILDNLPVGDSHTIPNVETFVATNPTATINGGHLESNYRVIFNRSDLFIHDGVIESNSYYQQIDGAYYFAYAVAGRVKAGFEDKIPYMKMTGGKVLGIQGAMSANDGIMEITGGECTAQIVEGKSSFYGLYVDGENTKAYISGGTINGGSSNKYSVYSYDSYVEISGGTFNKGFYNSNIASDSYYEIVDGIYEVKKSTENDGKVATVDRLGYASLQEAIDAAKAGKVVKLLKDVTLTEALSVKAGYNLTIDFNGHIIDIKGTTDWLFNIYGEVTFDDSKSTDKLSKNQGGIQNAQGQTKASGTGNGVFQVKEGGRVTINGGYFFSETLSAGGTIVSYGSLVVNGGYIESGRYTVYSFGSLEINDGYLLSHSHNGYLWAYNIISAGDLVINNGTVIGIQGAVSINSGSAVINSGTFETRDEVDPNWPAYSGSKAFHALYVASEGTETKPVVTVNGGTFTAKGSPGKPISTGETDTGVFEIGKVVLVNAELFGTSEAKIKPSMFSIAKGSSYKLDGGHLSVKSEAATEIQFAYRDINLNDSLGVRLFVEAEKIDQATSASVVFYKEVYVGDNVMNMQQYEGINLGYTEVGGVKYYVYGFNGISFYEMTSKVYAQLLLEGQDGYTIVSDRYNYSVAEYARSMILNNPTDANLISALTKLLEAGAAFQTLKGYHTSDLATNYIPTNA